MSVRFGKVFLSLALALAWIQAGAASFEPVLVGDVRLSTAEIFEAPLGETMGIPNGIYQGSGKLISDTALVPNVRFASVRSLKDGVIEATTQATLFGINVAKATAKLKVVPTSEYRFDLLDLNRPFGNSFLKAGTGQCNSQGCSFKAVVMGGELTLIETWVATANGFKIVNGSQVFKGKKAHYEAELSLR